MLSISLFLSLICGRWNRKAGRKERTEVNRKNRVCVDSVCACVTAESIATSYTNITTRL